MGMDNYWFNAIYSVTPTILVGGIFVIIVRSIIKADSHERKARAKIEAEERKKLAARLATENRDENPS
ncbi:hypothetical protein [Herbiconiux sp. A18JL235]|uniref:Lysyl-tRNA synthetase n=1 Tax=Herbiconiux sp. A18JL235 TaxID=3152363 RepID=A0AB39BLZ9_9MICO